MSRNGFEVDVTPGKARLLAPKVSPRQAEKAYREFQALRLRARGHDYETIGEVLGIDTKSARALVERAMERLPVEAGLEARRLEMVRLDELMLPFYEKALEGHGPSFDRVMLAMERRAKLLGLDVPEERDYSILKTQFFDRLREVLPRLLGEAQAQEVFLGVARDFAEKAS